MFEFAFVIYRFFKLLYAVTFNHIPTVKKLGKLYRDNKNAMKEQDVNFAMHVAADYGMAITVDILQKAGAKCWKGKTGLIVAAERNDDDSARIILEGARTTEYLEAKDDNGNSALDWAIQNKNAQIVNMLASFRTEGATDLIAFVKMNSIYEVSRILELQQTAEYLNSADKDGFTAMDWAVMNGSPWMVKCLNDAGIDYIKKEQATHIAAKWNKMEYIRRISQESDHRLSVEEDDFQMTPLRWAVVSRNIEIVRIICDSFNAEEQQISDDLLFWLACDTGDSNIVEYMLDNREMFSTHIKEQRGRDGSSPLDVTIAKQNLKVLECLINEKIVSLKDALLESCKLANKECFNYVKKKMTLGAIGQIGTELMNTSIKSDFVYGIRELLQQGIDHRGYFNAESKRLAEERYSKSLHQVLLNSDPQNEDSELIQMSRQFPSYNKVVEKTWPSINIYAFLTRSLRGIDLKEIEPYVIGELCPVLGKECDHEGEKRNNCDRIKDMKAVVDIIRKYLHKHETFKHLNPQFKLIGSIKEGTRIANANELDIMVEMSGLDPNGLTEKGCDPYSFEIQGDKLKGFAVKDQNNRDQFSFPRFLEGFLKVIKTCLECKRDEISEHNITFELKFDENCQQCSEEKSKSDSIYAPYMHCGSCLPAVTHTKVGACLIMMWKQDTIVTIDLVPMFPVANKDIDGMFRNVLATLKNDNPPFWARHFQKVITEDRATGEDMLGWREGEVPPLASMKLLHYGPDKDHNSIIRPKQLVDVHIFQSKPHLREVYCYIKVLKDIFKIDIPSYTVKKIVLSPKYLQRNGTMEILLDVLSESVLKEKFKHVIDYDDTERKRQAMVNLQVLMLTEEGQKLFTHGASMRIRTFAGENPDYALAILLSVVLTTLSAFHADGRNLRNINENILVFLVFKIMFLFSKNPDVFSVFHLNPLLSVTLLFSSGYLILFCVFELLRLTFRALVAFPSVGGGLSHLEISSAVVASGLLLKLPRDIFHQLRKSIRSPSLVSSALFMITVLYVVTTVFPRLQDVLSIATVSLFDVSLLLATYTVINKIHFLGISNPFYQDMLIIGLFIFTVLPLALVNSYL